MFLNDEPGDASYNYFFGVDYFSQVINDMFGTLVTKSFGEQLRLSLLIRQYPMVVDVAAACGHSLSHGMALRTRFNKTPYFTNGAINDMFFIDYYRQAIERFDIKEEVARLSLLQSSREMVVTTEHTSDLIRHVLAVDHDTRFTFDASAEIRDVDYSSTNVQYIRLSSAGSDSPIPYFIDYCYRCKKCNTVTRYKAIPRSTRCMSKLCDGVIERDESNDKPVVVYVSSVLHGAKHTPIISLVEIPKGEFDAAVVVRFDSHNQYYFFVVSINVNSTTDIVACGTRHHMVWQLIELIDGVHQAHNGSKVDGLDYYKASLVCMAVANAAGIKYNMLVTGNSSCRALVPQLYLGTVSRLCPHIDIDYITASVVNGGYTMINIHGQKIAVHAHGLFAANEFVIIGGCELKRDNVSVRAVKRLIGSNQSNVVAVADTHEKRWIETQKLFDVSNFALVFHINHDGLSECGGVPVYSDNIRQYIKQCAEIDVSISTSKMEQVHKLSSDLVLDDSRFGDRTSAIVDTLRISAMMCGRDHLIKLDFDFVRSLFNLTCRPVGCAEFGQFYDTQCTDEQEHEKSIDDFIDAKARLYGIFGDGRNQFESSIKSIVSELVVAFDIREDEAVGCVREHILSSQNSNPFDVAAMLPSQCKYFSSDVDDVSDLFDFFVMEFGRKKTIPKSVFGDLSDRGVDIGRINNCLVELKMKGWIDVNGDDYVWVKP